MKFIVFMSDSGSGREVEVAEVEVVVCRYEISRRFLAFFQ